jgi:hypothetical protein
MLSTPLAQATTFGNPDVAWTTGGVAVGSTYYAKSGSTLTLIVNTDSTARCVSVAGLPTQTSNGPKTSWTFSVPVPPLGTADGVRSTTVTIGEDANRNGVCNKETRSATASYVLDNTGPAAVPTVNLSPTRPAGTTPTSP